MLIELTLYQTEPGAIPRKQLIRADLIRAVVEEADKRTRIDLVGDEDFYHCVESAAEIEPILIKELEKCFSMAMK